MLIVPRLSSTEPPSTETEEALKVVEAELRVSNDKVKTPAHSPPFSIFYILGYAFDHFSDVSPCGRWIGLDMWKIYLLVPDYLADQARPF